MTNPVPKHLRLFHDGPNNVVVQHHSQANTERAKQSGYIFLRLEPWVEKQYPGFTAFLVQQLNGGGE